MSTGKLLRVHEAAAALNLKPSTIRAWIHGRHISVIKVGRRAVRIPQSEILRLIEQGTVPRRAGRGKV